MPVSRPDWFWLWLAILTEVGATSALQASQQFTRPLPSAAVLIGYALSAYLMSPALRTLPVGVVHAVWSGMGVVLIALIGRLIFGQRLAGPALAGIGLILAGCW